MDPKKLLEASVRAIESLGDKIEDLMRTARLIVTSVKGGGSVYFLGNGGSAADAQHLAAEMVGRFERERKAIPAVALTADTSILTSISNDYGFDTVFERQVEAHIRHNDVVVGITTSGKSPNVLRALNKAREMGAATVLLTGANWADKMKSGQETMADIVIAVGSENTARIQEAHIVAGHLICHLVEEGLFEQQDTD